MPLRENLVVNNKDNRVLMSRNYIGLIVAPWKFDVLKTSIFALEASLLGQIFVSRTSNFGGQLSADSSSRETLYCLNSFAYSGFTRNTSGSQSGDVLPKRHDNYTIIAISLEANKNKDDAKVVLIPCCNS